MRMNNQYLGAKTEASKKDFKKWMVDGRFLPLDSQPHKYIYHHSRHANCSSVKFSQLYDLWCIKRINMIKLLKKYPKCSHNSHDTLQPFFQDNDNFWLYLIEQMQDCQCVERMKKLSEYKQDIEKDELTPDMLLYQPKTSVCDWNENTWSRRLLKR